MLEQFTEFDLLKELEPTILASYEAHMHPTPTRSPQPIPAVATLARMAHSSVDRDIQTAGETDLLIYGPALRISLERHLSDLEQEKGLNPRSVLAAAFLVNLLTEDNLPYYSMENDKIASLLEIFAAWLREWIAEEDGHGVIMRDYALLTALIGDSPGLITHTEYQQGRVSQLRSGMGIRLTTLAQAGAYLTTQELATYYAHLNLGYLLDKPGKSMMRRISGQEYNHYEFYSSLVKGLLELDPDRTMIAIRDQFRDFQMPGAIGIPNFKDLSKEIAIAGIFDPATITLIKSRLIKEWDLEDRKFYSDDAKQAQVDVIDPNSRQNRLALRLSRLVLAARDKAVEEARSNAKILPFILGHTAEITEAPTKDTSPESETAARLLAS